MGDCLSRISSCITTYATTLADRILRPPLATPPLSSPNTNDPLAIAQGLETRAAQLSSSHRDTPLGLSTAYQMKTVLGLHEEALVFRLQAIIETPPATRASLWPSVDHTIRNHEDLSRRIALVSPSSTREHRERLGGILIALGEEAKRTGGSALHQADRYFSLATPILIESQNLAGSTRSLEGHAHVLEQQGRSQEAEAQTQRARQSRRELTVVSLREAERLKGAAEVHLQEAKRYIHHSDPDLAGLDRELKTKAARCYRQASDHLAVAGSSEAKQYAQRAAELIHETRSPAPPSSPHLVDPPTLQRVREVVASSLTEPASMRGASSSQARPSRSRAGYVVLPFGNSHRLGSYGASAFFTLGSGILAASRASSGNRWEAFSTTIFGQQKSAFTFQFINQGFETLLFPFTQRTFANVLWKGLSLVLPGGLAPLLSTLLMEGYSFSHPLNQNTVQPSDLSHHLENSLITSMVCGIGTAVPQALLASMGLVGSGVLGGFLFSIGGIAAGCYLSSQVGEYLLADSKQAIYKKTYAHL